jgi:hypothetical protein
MPETIAFDDNICRELLSSKLSAPSMEQALLKKGILAEHIADYLKEIKRIKNAKRRSTGFVCMAAGAFLGFLSCVLSITHAIPGMFEFIFYGLTTMAVCIVVLGLYYVFE